VYVSQSIQLHTDVRGTETTAVAAYTRDRLPLNWVMTQNSLGKVLEALGQREERQAGSRMR
jgi:hypothetical protein